MALYFLVNSNKEQRLKIVVEIVIIQKLFYKLVILDGLRLLTKLTK